MGLIQPPTVEPSKKRTAHSTQGKEKNDKHSGAQPNIVVNIQNANNQGAADEKDEEKSGSGWTRFLQKKIIIPVAITIASGVAIGTWQAFFVDRGAHMPLNNSTVDPSPSGVTGSTTPMTPPVTTSGFMPVLSSVTPTSTKPQIPAPVVTSTTTPAPTFTPTQSCPYYDLYLQSNPIAFKFLSTVRCGTGTTTLKLRGMEDSDMVSLVPAIRQLTSLTTIDFDTNNLKDAAISNLTMVLNLGCFPNLKDLILSTNKWGNSGAKTLASSFQYLPALTDLQLGSNYISDSGMAAMGSEFPTTLQFLYLQNNNIGNAGVSAWASGRLPLLSSLKGLLLQCNNIGDAGANAIATGLKQAAPQLLSTVDVHGNTLISGSACNNFRATVASIRPNVAITINCDPTPCQ